MMTPVSRLDIKPLTTYHDGKSRRTTLTSFEDMLERQKMTSTEEDTKVQESKTLETKKVESNVSETKGASSTDSAIIEGQSSTRTTSLYSDPSTGKTVKYVDVAESKKNSESTEALTKSTYSTETTSVDSMKKTKYDVYFKEAAKKYGVSESLLKGIAKAESNFNAKDVSSAGAMGVMQLMPATAKELGVDDPYDARQNILGGAKCISQKLKEFKGDESLALAAYNAGSGTVRRYGGVPSYCKSYVSKVLSYKKAFETAKSA